MRAIYSYGVAGLIVLVMAAWLATGTFVAGGHGPGKGERPIIAMGEHQELHHEGDAEYIDPHLTIAERVAQAGGSETVARSVRTETFVMKPMALEAPLRGRTKAKSVVSAVPETAGVLQTVHVAKGQHVNAGDLLCTLEQGTRRRSSGRSRSRPGTAGFRDHKSPATRASPPPTPPGPSKSPSRPRSRPPTTPRSN